MKMKRDLKGLTSESIKKQRQWNEIWLHLGAKSTNNRETEMSIWVNLNS